MPFAIVAGLALSAGASAYSGKKASKAAGKQSGGITKAFLKYLEPYVGQQFSFAEDYLKKGYGKALESNEKQQQLASGLGTSAKSGAADAYQSALGTIGQGAIGKGLSGSSLMQSAQLGAAEKYAKTVAEIDETVTQIQLQLEGQKGSLEAGKGTSLADLAVKKYGAYQDVYAGYANALGGIQYQSSPLDVGGILQGVAAFL